MHVYRWDLDRTYLDTDIGSVRSLVRHALEPAANKRCIPGASALLRGLLANAHCRVSIISGSPVQMRATLEEKLRLDGVHVDHLVLKDSLKSLRRGQIRAVTGQLGYKLPQLFRLRAGLGPPVRETLFGDDSEWDALVYALYADAISGRIDASELGRVMEAGGAYRDAIADAVRALEQVGRADAVEDIFIHVDRGVPNAHFRLLGSRLIPVFSWFQAALVLWSRRRLTETAVCEVANDCTREGGVDELGFIGLLQDLTRRGVVASADILELIDAMIAPPAPIDSVHRALRALGSLAPANPTQARAQYIAFLRAMQQSASARRRPSRGSEPS